MIFHVIYMKNHALFLQKIKLKKNIVSSAPIFAWCFNSVNNQERHAKITFSHQNISNTFQKKMLNLHKL